MNQYYVVASSQLKNSSKLLLASVRVDELELSSVVGQLMHAQPEFHYQAVFQSFDLAVKTLTERAAFDNSRHLTSWLEVAGDMPNLNRHRVAALLKDAIEAQHRFNGRPTSQKQVDAAIKAVLVVWNAAS